MTRDADKPARTFDQIQAVVQFALTLFRLTGGESLDLQLRSLDRTAEMFQLQTQAALEHGKDPGCYGPTVTPYEARMSASAYARLNAQREAKMAQCMAWAEEGAEAAATKATEKATPAGTSNPQSERASERTPSQKAAGAEQDGTKASATSTAAALDEDGDASDFEFVDATKSPHPDAMTTRIGQIMADLSRD
jgi:hypothetical protein